MSVEQEEKGLLVVASRENVEQGKGSAAGPLILYKVDDFLSPDWHFANFEKISILSLHNCGITTLPNEVQKLNLKQLILSNNRLKEVPSCLYSNLYNLELLDLSSNCLKNFDVEPACSCTIITLIINNNTIHNVPHWILTLRCPKLENFIYSENYVCSLQTSHELNLKNIEMCNCLLIDAYFTFFKVIKTLQRLDISNNTSKHNQNNFRDFEKLFIKPKWVNLEILILNNLVISILPNGLFWINTITELHLKNCDLSWIPDDVKYLHKLKLLDVSNNSIISVPRELSGLENLRVFKAAYNFISSIGVFASQLEILDLYNNYLEIIPEDNFDYILMDFEMNLVTSSSFQNYSKYKIKRDKYRKIFNLDRYEGPQEIPKEEFSDNDDEYSTCSEDDCSYQDNQDYPIELDNWDEVRPKNEIEKNPEITSSDDEWDGKIGSLRSSSEKNCKRYFDTDEDWIFCDVI